MSRLIVPKDQDPEEEDYDYTEELGDDQSAGATSHPTL
jgi:hypothetical protein